MPAKAANVRHKPSKPLLRGWLHQIAAVVSIFTGCLLVNAAPTKKAAVGAGVYALSLATLFGTSAAYHRPTWSPSMRQIMRRLDHSAIFFLIAGSYTPFVLLLFPESGGQRLLMLVWGFALLGVAQSVCWPAAPKFLVAALCVALGWTVLLEWKVMREVMRESMTTVQIGLICGGGLIYTLGAVVYAIRKPDPFPSTFGYHEVFHALTIVAAGCHLIVVQDVVLGHPANVLAQRTVLI
jgi:hemolysin III